MTCYIVEGHRGAGKSLFAVNMAKDYLLAGRRVASNVKLHLDHLMPARSKETYLLLPGVPRSEDMRALGDAYDGLYDEKKFGLVILDEAGMWLNTREWNDKDRKGVYAWLTQSRKARWDLILLIQDWEALDAQIRRALIDTHVTAACLDRVRIPYTPFKLPKIHRYTGRYKGPAGVSTGSIHLRGKALYKAYDTDQRIALDETLLEDGSVIDARGMSSGLSAWHLVGRYLPPEPKKSDFVLFALKWLIAWPTLLFDRPGADSTAMDRFRADLAMLMPLRYPHIARAEWKRRKRPLRARLASLDRPAAAGPSHQAYNLARMIAEKRKATVVVDLEAYRSNRAAG